MGTFIKSDFISTDTSAPIVVPLIASDRFNRANSATLGTTEIGAFPWQYKAGTYNISGGQLASGDATTYTPADCWFDPAKKSGTLRAKIIAIGNANHAGVLFRRSAVNDTGWAYFATASAHTLAKRTASDSFTVVPATGTNAGFVSGETVEVVFNNTTGRIICSVNGVITHDVTDTTYAAQTGVGVECRLSTTANQAKWEDFTLAP